MLTMMMKPTDFTDVINLNLNGIPIEHYIQMPAFEFAIQILTKVNLSHATALQPQETSLFLF